MSAPRRKPAPPGEPILGGIAHTAADRAEPLLRPGNTNCGGCGMSIALNMLSRAIGSRPIQIVIPACCGIVTAGPFPFSAYGAPVIASTFAAAAAVATGLARVARANGEATRILCFAGDGGTYDIGLATISAAAERNEDVLFICYDNEIYGNTGGQRSSATPFGAATTTTPAGKHVEKKDILGVMAAHRIPYAASVSMANAEDMMRKLGRALDAEGFRFLHILSPCPTGWKSEPADGIDLIRLAVESGLYPVIEVVDGRSWAISVEPTFSRDALQSFIERQGRFTRSKVQVEDVRAAIERTWADLRDRTSATAARGAAERSSAGSRGPSPLAPPVGSDPAPIAAE